MARRFFATFSMLVALGCGAPRGQPASGGAASIPGPDAGQPSTGPTAGTGQPDAGPVVTPPDAGIPPDCSANAPYDSRCFHAGTASVAVSEFDAPQCAALLPVNVPAPVLITDTFLDYATVCGAIPDGDGHLGVCRYSPSASGPFDTTGTDVIGSDGTVLARLSGRVRKSQPQGFLTEHDGVDYGQPSELSGWSPPGGGSLLLGRVPYPLEPDPPGCAWASGPDSRVTATCWSPESGGSLRRFDDALVQAGDPLPLAEPIAIYGIDDQQRILAVDVPAGTLRWRDLDGGVLSEPVAGKVGGPIRSLVGGGFDTSSGVLLSGSTQLTAKPAWLAGRADGDLTLVRGRQAYAYVPPPPSGCTQRMELLAADGTLCATVDVTEPDCAPGQHVVGPMLQVGAVGSVASRAGSYCQGGTCAVGWHVWTRLFP